MEPDDIKRISIIGAGMMGHGIAQHFATKNYNIILLDKDNESLKKAIDNIQLNICPQVTILASNTSVISISKIASKSKNRERIVGTHFWFPPFLIPLVEVVKASDTSESVMEVTYQFMRRAGKHPIKCFKDVSGFVGNRLQHALWREAISKIEHGIADAKTVDESIKNSIGIRLAVLGPIENADMVGLDLT